MDNALLALKMPIAVVHHNSFDICSNRNCVKEVMSTGQQGEKSAAAGEEDELKLLALKFSPSVSQLLSEEALEILLNSNTWNEEEAIMNSPWKQRDVSSEEDDDDDEQDGLRRELQRLGAAEESLREELELSNSFGMSLFGSPLNNDQKDVGGVILQLEPEEQKHRVWTGTGGAFKTKSTEGEAWFMRSLADSDHDESEKDEEEETTPFRVVTTESHNSRAQDARPSAEVPDPPQSNSESLPSAPQQQPQSHYIQTKQYYTPRDHAKTLDIRFDPKDLSWPSSPILSRADVESIMNIPTFHSILVRQVDNSSGHNLETEHATTSVTTEIQMTKSRKDEEGKRELHEKVMQEVLDCTREYIKPLSTTQLCKLFVGLAEYDAGAVKKRKQGRRDSSATTTAEIFNEATQKQTEDEERAAAAHAASLEHLPVRTVTIRIRPDVLCGAVMDAVASTVFTLGGEITKRQGGHLRAILPGCWVSYSCSRVGQRSGVGGFSNDFDGRDSVSSPSSGIASFWSFASSPRERNYCTEEQKHMIALPAYLIDAQLCTRKASRQMERILLIRAYGVEEGDAVDGGAATAPSMTSFEVVEEDDFFFDSNTTDSVSSVGEGGLLIREAAALVQRLDSDMWNVPLDERSDIVSSSLQVQSDHTSEEERSNNTNACFSQQIGNILSSPMKILSGPDKKIAASPKRKSSQRGSKGTESFPILVRRQSARQAAGAKLVRDYKPSPSVREKSRDCDPIPSLSIDDWPFVQSSWRFLKECLSELDNRDLAYSAFASCSFGAFPALPTLDVQYCSHIRLICRENMIKSLLKTASELEQYARESEYSCAKLVHLLRPTFDAYHLEAPSLPKSVPLTAYPLDFQQPEALCPPWGQKVMEALNRVAATSSTENSRPLITSANLLQNETSSKGFNWMLRSTNNENIAQTIDGFSHGHRLLEKKTQFCRARDATSLIVSAFQRQADEEQSARLGRKNLQVMDRLAKMQAYKRDSIISIRDAYGSNRLAIKAADDFHTKIQQAEIQQRTQGGDYDDRSSPQEQKQVYAASDQVPLFSCRVLRGNSTGTCYVTAYEILVVTQLIPLLGGNTCHKANLSDITLELLPPSNLILNRPAGVVVRALDGGKELFSFIPSLASPRFIEFVEIVKAIALESPDALRFSTRGGLLYMFDDNNGLVANKELTAGL